MRVLVTGAAGFLGSHLCDRLLSDGHEVVALDNLLTGSLDNISHLSSHSKFEFVLHDITIPINVDVERIYNMASPASPFFYQLDPIQTLKINVMGAINMLDLARRVGARILQASTSEVYGDPSSHPQKENYWGNVNPIGPRACYNEGKRAAETLFFDYQRQHQVEIRVARIFNTFGPRMAVDDGRVVSNFIARALRNEDLAVFGDGSQTRSFCYVDDLINGLVALMNSDAKIDQPVNLGNDHEVPILDLADLIIKETNSNSRIALNPLPDDDPRKRRPDLRYARATLGWSPQTTLVSGLRSTIGSLEGGVT